MERAFGGYYAAIAVDFDAVDVGNTELRKVRIKELEYTPFLEKVYVSKQKMTEMTCS